ncbi:MAG: hypothetical protein H0U53_02025, partial [Actinobacteria bacterium]|nr:hypothetical protein [Actinomycetota bacterium]
SDLVLELRKIESKQAERDAINKALSDAVDRQSAGSVTGRQFYVGIGGLAVAVAGLLVAVNPSV